MRREKTVDLIKANIKSHEINEHMYRQLLESGHRTTTRVTKDEIIDLILDHLGLEVEIIKPAPGAAKLVKKKVESP